jgi:GTP-sensing pleiotropic transcriptional regulator CodY
VLNIIINELIKMIDVYISSVFLWNDKKESLKLEAINVASSFRKIAEKVMGKSILDFEISKSNDPKLTNPLLMCCYEKKIVESHKLYELTYPVISKKSADFLQKILQMKLNIAIPLYVGDLRLGVLSIIWKKDFIQTGDLVLLNYFATQISKSLYNAIRYDELNKKYIALQKDYSIK